MRKLIVLALPAIISVSAFAADATQPFGLETYLEQVQRNNQGYQGAVLNSQGAGGRSNEGSLVYAPQLFTNLQHADDRRQTSVPSLQGNRSVTNTFSLGVSKTTDFGLEGKLSYSLNDATIHGASPTLLASPGSVISGLSLELTQHLWRNGFGRSTRYSADAINSQARAVSLNNAYLTKVTLADAESRYWRLALARDSMKVQEQSVDRSVKIRDFIASRVKLELSEESDLLQSVAAVKARELDLKAALDEEHAARRAFNSARGIDSDEVPEQVGLPEPDRALALIAPERVEKREDVLAAEAARSAAIAASEAARDRQLPTLDAFSNLSTNGNAPAFGSAVSNTFTTQHPYVAVGLRFSVPLDVGATSAVRAGYAKEVLGTEVNFQRRLLDQEIDWKDLSTRFKEAKERFAAVLDLERIQLRKFELERSRQRRGQSTTYQVFLFEQDYLGSQLRRIQIVGQILNLHAQMKTYSPRGDL
ncbi:MAG: hypothetical protein A2X94_10340 [Bdellovibrionales bacterium GWB1_55_8]|nr:MAG: hypothetical protein A2X94_10340 [Bdellovibrionales bacterium GWB1_55_8]